MRQLKLKSCSSDCGTNSKENRLLCSQIKIVHRVVLQKNVLVDPST